MKRSQVFLIVSMVVVAILCCAIAARANLLLSGDFSTGTLSGWTTQGNVIASGYANIPLAYKNTWDLSEWSNQMSGSFALFETPPGSIYANTANVSNSTSFVLTLDYAVAWKPAYPLDGYFYVEVYGMTGDGRVHSLAHKEIEWGVFSGFDKGVFTGSLYTQDFIQYPDLMFKEILLDIQVFNLNQPWPQIVGIDNISLSITPTPIPEPSSLLLLGLGLAGYAGFKRKSRSV
jgi:hypothetical protein